MYTYLMHSFVEHLRSALSSEEGGYHPTFCLPFEILNLSYQSSNFDSKKINLNSLTCQVYKGFGST